MYDVNYLLQSDEISPIFKPAIKSKFNLLPKELQELYVNDVKLMSAIGVKDDEDQKVFYYVYRHVPDILRDICGKCSSDEVAEVSAIVYSNRDKLPISSIVDLFRSVNFAVREANIPIRKVAYPQGRGFRESMVPYDLQRWMQATKDIYLGISQGKSFEQMTNQITSGWTSMEKRDYKNWLRFYQENTHEKYKIAQYEGTPGVYIPNIKIDDLKSDLPKPFREVEENAPQRSPDEEKREKIEGQRSRIISRLNAAEKLLYSLDGQFFAGDDQEIMLKLLQDLKRKVQTANKVHIQSRLFIDLIYKTANMLSQHGHEKGSQFFRKIAQLGGMDMMGMGMDAPAETPAAPSGEGSLDDTQKALKEFFALLETGVADVKGKEKREKRVKEREERRRKRRQKTAQVATEDIPIAPAEMDAPAPPRARQPLAPEMAPAAPPKPIPAPMPVEKLAPAIPDEIEVSEEEEAPQDDGVEDVFNAALQDVSVGDVIKRLEIVTSIYKRRELSRQLAILDIMMDRLGIGSFFPSLGEAMGKSLESNQYISTRVDDILAKLKGMVVNESAISEMTGLDSNLPKETSELRKLLKTRDQQEAEVKERRKQRDVEKELEPPVGEQAQEQMGAPAPVQTAPPVPVPVR